MNPNNTLSVLPWYTSIEQQNARKWWVYDRVYPLYTPATFILPFQIMRTHREGTAIMSFVIYKRDGTLVGDYTTAVSSQIVIKKFESLGYDVIVFTGIQAVFETFPIGQYYAVLSDGTDTWYSEVYTAVGDMSGYLKIEWWDNEDFVMDAGTIVYTYPTFHNVVYLQADIAKPEYPFEEEGEARDGYYFPYKQISEKRYKFSFLASEYMLDVLRFVRMADFVSIAKAGVTYRADSFLITPEWDSAGDIATVSAEFDTATVAKKLGNGYIAGRRGDFNNDYNNDFFNI